MTNVLDRTEVRVAATVIITPASAANFLVERTDNELATLIDLDSDTLSRMVRGWVRSSYNVRAKSAVIEYHDDNDDRQELIYVTVTGDREYVTTAAAVVGDLDRVETIPFIS